MSNTTITCGDWTDKYNNVHKGCGAVLRWPTDEEKRVSGSKRPVNPDGSPHKHAESKPTPPAAATPATTAKPAFTTNGNGNNGQRAYYEGIIEVQKASNTSEVNSMLKEGWVILKLDSETTYIREAENERVDHAEGVTYRLMQTSSIIFVLGRRVP